MEPTGLQNDDQALSALCDTARELMAKGAYQACEQCITAAMGAHPHAPQPHNLIGLLLEKMNDRHAAMKHFRAACALDPAYVPARRNIERFASLYSQGVYAFDEADCFQEYAGGPIMADHEKQDAGHIIACVEGCLNIIKVSIAQTAPIAGKKLWEIGLPPEVIIGCILRGDQSIVPCGNTRVLAGDVLILISADKQEASTIRRLTGNL